MTFGKFWFHKEESRKHILHAEDMRLPGKREPVVHHFIRLDSHPALIWRWLLNCLGMSLLLWNILLFSRNCMLVNKDAFRAETRWAGHFGATWRCGCMYMLVWLFQFSLPEAMRLDISERKKTQCSIRLWHFSKFKKLDLWNAVWQTCEAELKIQT